MSILSFLKTGKHLKEDEQEELRKLRKERKYYEKIVSDKDNKIKELEIQRNDYYNDSKSLRQTLLKIEKELTTQQYNSIVNLTNKVLTAIRKELSKTLAQR